MLKVISNKTGNRTEKYMKTVKKYIRYYTFRLREDEMTRCLSFFLFTPTVCQRADVIHILETFAEIARRTESDSV